MATKRKNRGLIALAILVLLLLMLGRKKPAGGAGGAATPGGSIGSVDLTQAYYEARAHLVVKRVGDTVTLGIIWTAATRDSLGQPINWNYGISWRYRQNITGDLRGGKFINLGSHPNGNFNFSASDVLDFTFFTGNWDVEVSLHADTSTADGQPSNDMAVLKDDALAVGFLRHVNAFKVV